MDFNDYQIITKKDKKILTDKNQSFEIDLNKIFYGTVCNYRYYGSVKIKGYGDNLQIEQIVKDCGYGGYRIHFRLISEKLFSDFCSSNNKEVIYKDEFLIKNYDNKKITNRTLYKYLVLFAHNANGSYII